MISEEYVGSMGSYLEGVKLELQQVKCLFLSDWMSETKFSLFSNNSDSKLRLFIWKIFLQYIEP